MLGKDDAVTMWAPGSTRTICARNPLFPDLGDIQVASEELIDLVMRLGGSSAKKSTPPESTDSYAQHPRLIEYIDICVRKGVRNLRIP
jgi:hypothetical protein